MIWPDAAANTFLFVLFVDATPVGYVLQAYVLLVKQLYCNAFIRYPKVCFVEVL